MTVLDEHTNIKKYSYLRFIEFLDMLCRVAITMISKDDTLDYNTHFLLELMWVKAIEKGVFEADLPLWPVDESIKY